MNAPFYVGFRQIDADRLNVGFDRNTDNSSNTFYSLNGGVSWLTSTIQGSMMMRPIFSTAGNADLGLIEVSELNWTVYPNPTSGNMTIGWNESTPFPGGQLQDMNGRVLKVLEENETSIDLADFPAGCYFVKLASGYPSIKKINFCRWKIFLSRN
jgi:hypothetical protein